MSDQNTLDWSHIDPRLVECPRARFSPQKCPFSDSPDLRDPYGVYGTDGVDGGGEVADGVVMFLMEAVMVLMGSGAIVMFLML